MKKIGNDCRYYCANTSTYAENCTDIDCYRCRQRCGNTPLREQIRFYLPLTLIVYSLLIMTSIFFDSFAPTNLAKAKKGSYVCGTISNCCSGARKVEVLSGSVEALSNTTLLMTIAYTDISHPHNGGYYKMHKTMILDAEGKRYQLLGKDGKLQSSKWKDYDDLSSRVLDIVIIPEARVLYK